MPTAEPTLRPLQFCKAVGCHALTRHRRGYCPKHLWPEKDEASRVNYQANHANQEQRKKAWSFYASPSWKALRTRVLAEEPYCRICKKRGYLTVSTHVDHIIPRADNTPELNFERNNLQALCKPCHYWKTQHDLKGTTAIFAG
jgi:5-methylcytosine-specific restriction protein A